MGIGGGINGENSGYIGVVTIVDYFSTLSDCFGRKAPLLIATVM